MKTIVLGGGVVGVTTAYYLAKDGHEVELIDAATEFGTGATGGNAGLIAPGHSFAWASPNAPRMLVKSLFGKQTAIRVKPKLDPRLYAWGLRFLRECTLARAKTNTLVKLRLCQYSQRMLDELAQEENIDYGQTNRGVLYLYRDERELEVGAQKMQLLADHGQKIETLDADGVVNVEPTLGPVKDKIVGAVYGLTDGSGDSQLFSNRVADVCRKMGATFHLGRQIRALDSDGDSIAGVVTDEGILRGDSYVLSLGVDSPKIAKTVGVRIPVYPAKGYSVTFPIADDNNAPIVGGVDEELLVAWCRLGDSLRMTSTAEFAGYDRTWKPKDYWNIHKMAKTLFPNAANYSRGRYRACLRPMTPDGPAIIGRGPHRNLFYNTGHGHMGWTMACGSSRAAADIVAGKKPEFDVSGHHFRY
jgi:D-amino-acid dehydrogenase